MDDSEMTTMWDFLTDSNLDEILDDKVTSADAAANFLETAIVKIEPSVVTFQWDESSVASFTSSEDMSSVASFNSDEEAEVPLLPHQLRRQRQRVYDKTYRSKAKVSSPTCQYNSVWRSLIDVLLG
ncbi:unnamed protein product [Phytophthora lilii]|uniref:Unnamed protein product n=1 Tax=Phytophthora lilii TaxID=2077276 RepID=A0A9W6WTV2_9STRA|nr:unnamed protein product [Phytophthora lilii]